jgi:hypothetical protein
MMVDPPSASMPPRIALTEDDPLVWLGQEILLRDRSCHVTAGASLRAIRLAPGRHTGRGAALPHAGRGR